MFSSILSIGMFFLTYLLMQYIIEPKTQVKSKLVKKFGSTRYIIYAFAIVICFVITLSIINLDIFYNGWFQGITMGIWIFSVTGIHYTNKR